MTLIVQKPPGGTLPPQLLVWEKSPLFAPVIVILVIVKAAPPVFVTVTPWAAVGVPTSWLP
jgi:hypothetical protein